MYWIPDRSVHQVPTVLVFPQKIHAASPEDQRIPRINKTFLLVHQPGQKPHQNTSLLLGIRENIDATQVLIFYNVFDVREGTVTQHFKEPQN